MRVVSRFKEELEKTEKRLSASKPVFLSKLHLAIPKRARLATSTADGQDDQASQRWSSAPTSRYSSIKGTPGRNQSFRGASFQSEPQRHATEEQVAEAWQRAFRAEAQQRRDETRRSSSHLRRASQSVSRPSHKQKGPESSRPSKRSLTIEEAEAAGLDLSPTNNRLPHREGDDEGFHQSLDRSYRVLEEWSHQLEEQEALAKERSRPIVTQRWVSKPHKIVESWAKFPSHTRRERTGSAGPSDNVAVRDFAIRSASAAGEVRWSTDKDPTGVEPTYELGPRALTNKFGKALRTSFSKIMPGKRAISADADGAKGRRSSRQSSGDLEFPELELLPMEGGYKELRALEREFGFLKGVERPHRRVSTHPTGAEGDKSSFGSKMASNLHLDGSSDYGDDTLQVSGAHRSKSRDRSSMPVTPDPGPGATMTCHTQESASTGVDRWETPLSRLSVYDDAVSHRHDLLQQDVDRGADADSVKSDTTVVRKARACTVPNLTALGSGPAKFKTWSGRAKTQPVLMKSTLEFGAELERMLHRERERARGLGRSLEVARAPSNEGVAVAA